MSIPELHIELIKVLTKAIEVAQSGARCGPVMDDRSRMYEQLEESLVGMLTKVAKTPA
jgi:hypothetical protein